MPALPDPPDFNSMDPASMSAGELRVALESLWEWLEEAQMAPLADAPDDEIVEAAEAKMVEITRERRDRHSDEPAPRGG
jgi:hypothetical protein